jgi:DNA/RNA-binding domain of Phe-tRNA-synthetase-like protein
MVTPLKISAEIYDKIPDLVVISGFLEVGKPDKEGISSYLDESWANLTREIEAHGHSTHTRIRQWREALQRANVSVKKYPPSIQALAKRTQKSTTPFSINPVVDTYNAISMDLILPAGAYDLHKMDGGLKLRLSNGFEDFYPIGGKENKPTLPKEIVYSDEEDVLTRQFLWQQSEKAKISDSSTNVVFVCELLAKMGEDLLESAHQTIKDRFTSLLNGEISELCIHRK